MGAEETLLAGGGVESIGAEGAYRVRAGDRPEEGACACPTHLDALELCMAALMRLGVPVDMDSLDAVGYKAVHGGAVSGSQLVNDALMAEMERMIPFAPAHNPVYLAMMRSVRARYPRVIQIACFETTFHATIPPERAVYGVPYEWVEEFGLRRYGFHGSSHSYIAWRMAREAPAARRIISAHLGGSSSLCAILDGRSVANSLGATLQSGVFHNNRVGDMEAFCLPVLADRLGGMDHALEALATRSGFLGLSGVSNDLRLVEEAAPAEISGRSWPSAPLPTRWRAISACTRRFWADWTRWCSPAASGSTPRGCGRGWRQSWAF
jgi:acetate kinase